MLLLLLLLLPVETLARVFLSLLRTQANRFSRFFFLIFSFCIRRARPCTANRSRKYTTRPTPIRWWKYPSPASDLEQGIVPYDLTLSTLRITKWVSLRETYLEKLIELSNSAVSVNHGKSSKVSPGNNHHDATDADNNCAAVGESNKNILDTYKSILFILRKLTVSCISHIYMHRVHDPTGSPFLWGGVNYIVKLCGDVNFLTKVAGLESFLNIRLKDNPLFVKSDVHGNSATISKRRRKDWWMEWREVEITKCLQIVRQELSKEANDWGDGGDYNASSSAAGESFQDFCSALLNSVAFLTPVLPLPQLGAVSMPTFSHRGGTSAYPTASNYQLTSSYPKASRQLSGSPSMDLADGDVTYFPAAATASFPHIVPVTRPMMTMPSNKSRLENRSIKDAMFSLDSANKLIQGMQKIVDLRDQKDARESPIYTYFLLWKKWHWKQLDLKAMVERKRRKLMRDIFYSWAAVAYRWVRLPYLRYFAVFLFLPPPFSSYSPQSAVGLVMQ